ncbi:MAG: (Fe-S)-binding protein [Acidobacteriia bacterium]|nr:(Fe-S)-binding protein [Terriglobia bacterium]
MADAADRAGRVDLVAALRALDGVAGSRAELHAKACVRCGLCGQSCHFYLADPVPENLPAAKVEKLASLLRGRRSLLGRNAPWLSRARDLTPDALEELADAVFGRCTGCGRCSLHCSVGLDVSAVMQAARRVLGAAGLTPSGLRQTLDNQIRDGNQMSIPREELVETASWLSEELARETGDKEARVRVDETGSRVLYLVNPREVKFFPLSLQAAAGVFHAAGESWTLSSRVFDVTNYGFFAADDASAAELTRRAVEEAKRLGASEIVVSECGHGFRSFRWEGPEWLDGAYPVRVRSVLELLDEYLAGDRLLVDPSRNALPLTLHDPCNLVRWGGIVDPQRRVLARVAEKLVEMTPNREQNYCCGGGGGLLAMEEYGERRISSGAIKAAQIRDTGARIVACPCHNCADQLLELARVHALEVEIRSVVEIVYDAIDWSGIASRSRPVAEDAGRDA